MRCQSWRELALATLTFYIAGTEAQIPKGLDDLLSQHKNLSSFRTYLQDYPDVLKALPSDGGVTVLAPDNEAFDKIPSTALNKIFDQGDTNGIVNALQYHLLNGTRRTTDLVPGVLYGVPTLMTSSNYTNVTGGQRVTNVKQSEDVVVFISGLGTRCEVKEADLDFPGGVVQIINTPLIPPADLLTTTSSYNLTSFEGALYTTDRTEELSLARDLTIFAPTNEAFMALGPAISNMTLAQLSAVLDYHLVPSKLIYSRDIVNGTRFTTKSGGNLTVSQIGNRIYINSAQLLTKDVLFANGVIHTLDNVLNPKDDGPKPNPDKYVTQPPVFSSATKVDSIPFTTAIPCSTDCVATQSGVTNGGIAPTGTNGASGTPFRTSSSSGVAAAMMAIETGFAGAAGIMAMVGGAVMMI